MAGGLRGRKWPAKLSRLHPKTLRFGKRVRVRGRYYQEVRDQRGKLIARVKWYAGVRKDVRSVVNLQAGVSTRAGRKRLGVEVSGWTVEAYEVKTGEVIWVNDLTWEDTTPIGSADPRASAAEQRYIRPAIEDVDPYEWWHEIKRLPRRLKRAGVSAFTFRIHARDREGGLHIVEGTRWVLYEGIMRPSMLAQMLAEVLIAAARRYGYAGALELLKVELLMSGEAGK